MNRKKINLKIIKRKKRKEKYKQKREDELLSLFFWMFLWIVDGRTNYPGVGWILLMVVSRTYQ